ncbi:MAG TPA: serine/threonine-protein kinase [Gemmatimonadales bacterium]|nr:serine/threonine-protein kinase [Gemmatimonadales bacterium]
MTDAGQSQLPTLLRDALGDSYTIEGEIGRGGMGVVFRARDERLQRRVAIKALPPELAFQREIRERFTREAQTAARLSHPHIVPIHDVGEGNGVVYFVMGLIEGESLAARIRRRGRLPAEEARRVMKETADALTAAHGVGIVHRDIKPDNILLEGQRGRVMVTDFGIAKALSGTVGATLTSAGMAIGTPSFMSPEQAAGESEIDGRSDLYSLGIVTYQMLSGELPFNAPTVAGILMKHITEPAPLLHEKFDDVPEDLSLAVARCLEKDPENRWGSADALRRALENRNVSGYRPTGLGWKAAERPTTPGRDRLRRPIGGRPNLPERADRNSPAPPARRVPRALVDRPTRGDRDLPRAPMRSARNRSRDRKGEVVLPETGEPKVVRAARAEFARTAAVGGGLFMVNMMTGLDTPWFLFPVAWMSFSMFKKYADLWQAGYSWRDILNRPDAPDAVSAKGTARLGGTPRADQLGTYHKQMMMIHGDRAAIQSLMSRLSDADKAVVAEMPETVENLYTKAHEMALTLHSLDSSISDDQLHRIDMQMLRLQEKPEGEERDRQIGILERQRASCDELIRRRDEMRARFESQALAMQGLRFDLLRLREKGIGAVGSDLTHATQQARALSRDVDHAIEAATELRESLS